jgi:hypothetical protein
MSFLFGWSTYTHVYLGSLDATNSLDMSSIGEKLKAWMSKTYEIIEDFNQQNEMNLFDFGTL